MESLGIPAAKSRYARYEKRIAKFFDDAVHPTSIEGQQAWKDLTHAYRECIEIYLIFKTFAGCDHPNFISILAKVASGAEVPALAQAGTSRDFAYELLIAARFHLSSYAIRFDETSDVVAEQAGIRIRAECKRIASEKKLESRIKAAGGQLARMTVVEDDATLGLMFIDVSSCVASEVAQLVETRADAQNALNSAIGNFLQRNEVAIERLNDRFSEASYATCITATAPIWSRDLVLHATTGTAVSASRAMSDRKFERLRHALRSFNKGVATLF
ncbi:hypothetical protein [Lysobacter tyrosinilyticus]